MLLTHEAGHMAVAAITGINASIDDLTVVYPGENLWYSMISESVASSHLINDTVRAWAVSSNPKILSYSLRPSVISFGSKIHHIQV